MFRLQFGKALQHKFTIHSLVLQILHQRVPGIQHFAILVIRRVLLRIPVAIVWQNLALVTNSFKYTVTHLIRLAPTR